MAHEKYSKDHEYVRVEGDVATIGITHHAQEQLGDVVFVEVPEVGRKVKQGEQAAVVESVKAAARSTPQCPAKWSPPTPISPPIPRWSTRTRKAKPGS